MHVNLRLVHEENPETYSASEEQKVRACLLSAPGVVAVIQITRHIKGGYSVTVAVSDDEVDSMVSYISAAGYLLLF